MKYLLAGIIALFAVASVNAARAADMPVKAPPAPVSVYSWTGCYVGGNGGYAWNNGKSAYQDPNTADPINPPPGDSQILTPTSTDSSGLIGGGELGCNWQMDPRVVLGLEADIDAAHLSGSASTVVGPPADFRIGAVDVGAATLTGTASEQVLLRWLSTIRARVGVPVLSDRGLLFVTGGLAVGSVSSSGSVVLNSSAPAIYDAWGGSNSSTLTGWTVGGGLEYALTDHWTTKAEYLYYDLGNASHPLNLIASNSIGTYPTLGNTVSPVRGSIIRVGLNYKLN